jgi:hypothetical protein
LTDGRRLGVDPKNSGAENAPNFFGEEPGKSDRGFVGEVLRKAAVAGLGALFMTEEGVRNLAGQLKLPKEALGYLLAQAEKTKDEVGRVITEEVRKFLQSEKLREEFAKLVAGMAVEVTARIRLVPDSEAAANLEKVHPDGQPLKPEITVKEISARRRTHPKKKE